MVGFIWFLYKYYDRFTIYRIPKFWPLKIFFGELSVKKINFQVFLEGKGFIFASYLHSKLGNANVFALTDRTPFNWPACSEKFYHSFFSVSFRQEELKILSIFETDSTIPIAHCVSQLWRFFSGNSSVGSVCLLLSCIDKVAFDRGSKLGLTKLFRRRVFGENEWKPRFFQSATVILSHFSRPKPHVWHPNDCEAWRKKR